MFKQYDRNAARKRIHRKIRKKIVGTSERPRLCVYRSLNHIYAQIIDDFEGKTLAAASTLDPSLKGKIARGGNKEAAKEVGILLAQKAREKGITKVVFDRNGYKFHGRVAALAEGARENGLEF